LKCLTRNTDSCPAARAATGKDRSDQNVPKLDRRHSYPEIEWTPTLPFISEEYFKLMQDHLAELHTRYPGIAILNVPPDQTGRIPDAFVKRLNEVRDELRLDTTTTPTTGLMRLPGRQGPLQSGWTTWKEYTPLGRELPGPIPEGREDGGRDAVRLKGRSGFQR
jgi:hypothetical protein